MKHNKINRKAMAGTIFIAIVTFAAIGALLLFYINFSKQKAILEAAPAGITSSSIFTASARTEKALLYLDESSKVALDTSYAQIASKGGFSKEGIPCDYYIYPLWNTKDKELSACTPDASKELQNEFDYQLKYLLALYPEMQFFASYQYTLDTKDAITITGTTTDQIGSSVGFGNANQEQIKQTVGGQCPIVLTKIPSSIKCNANHCELADDTEKALVTLVQKLQAQGYILQINSAYRTMEDQTQEWLRYNKDSKMACEPSCGCPHVLGHAIDINLLDTNGNVINDHALVEQLMCANGWIRYTAETWHFEYGSERWKNAIAAGKCEG